MTHRILVLLLAALAVGRTAHAHHVTDFIVTSTEPAGGQLLVLYDWSAAAPVAFDYALGDAAVFSGTNPGFDTPDGDEFFPGTTTKAPILPAGVPVAVELIDADGGRASIKVNGTLLETPGQRALVGTAGAVPPADLHRHPEWRLGITGAEGTFAEAHVSFRVVTDAPGYMPSPVYTLRLTNGRLPAPEYAADAVDDASVACQAAVGSAVAPFVRTLYDGLRRCLDKAQTLRARQTAGADTARALVAAEKACLGRGPDRATLIGRVAAAQAKAAAAIRGRCGTDASGDFGDALISQHLGLVRCRTEELAAASYFRARTYLRLFPARASQGGDALADHFPCVTITSGEEEGRS